MIHSNVPDNGKRTFVRPRASSMNNAALRTSKLRNAFLRAVTPEDMTAIVRDIVDEARTGTTEERRWARETLFERCLGAPLPLDVLQQLEELQRMVAGDGAYLTEGTVIDQEPSE